MKEKDDKELVAKFTNIGVQKENSFDSWNLRVCAIVKFCDLDRWFKNNIEET